MGRRGNGEGSITRRKDGRYMARYAVQTTSGPKRKAIYGKTRAEVAAKLVQAIAARDGGVAFDATNMTFGQYLKRWLSDSVRGCVKERTLMKYECIVSKHLSPALGHVKLKELSAAHLQVLYRSKLDSGISTSTVLSIHTVASGALKQATRWGMVLQNVASLTTKPQLKKSEVEPLSLEDVKTLLWTAEAEGHRLLALYTLAVATGLRHGELLGLRWEDVDLEESGGRVRVKKPLVRTRAKKDGGKGYDFDVPKTKRARAVSFGLGAARALRTHRAHQNEERLRFGPAYEETGLIFTEEWGGLLRCGSP